MTYTKDFLLELYKKMYTIRVCEESLVDPILTGEVKCPCHLYSGQEAVAVGLCSAVNDSDYLFGNHRSHGHYLAKGGDLKAMIAEIFGKETGCSKGRGGSMHVIDTKKGMMGAAPIVGGTISLALGSALASWVKGEQKVTLCFFGDGAAGEGVLYESLNFAALNKLPIIFVCENNFYSTHMSFDDCRSKDSLVDSGTLFGMKSVKLDGNNVLTVYEKALEVVEHCKSGAGPVFIEAITYRLRGHVGPDDNIQGTHTDIRPESEIALWREKDPLIQLETTLKQLHGVDKDTLKPLREQVEKTVLEAFDYAKQSPLPDKSTLAHYVFQKEGN